MSAAHAWAGRLAGGGTIAEPVAVVVAHPDDETLWAGAALRRLPNARLILLTDGAPADMADAHRLGFATRADYAGTRAGEFDRALDALGVRPERRAYGIADQAVIETQGDTVRRLARDLDGMAAVLVHPYEGGHPDHDAAALAVRRAVAALPRPPAMVEYASYHLADGARRFGRFWPDPANPEQVRALSAEDRARVDAAIACHQSQAAVIGDWRPAVERWRAAPAYDFAAPPPPGASLYDGFGWAMTSARWRALAGVGAPAWA